MPHKREAALCFVNSTENTGIVHIGNFVFQMCYQNCQCVNLRAVKMVLATSPLFLIWFSESIFFLLFLPPQASWMKRKHIVFRKTLLMVFKVDLRIIVVNMEGAKDKQVHCDSLFLLFDSMCCWKLLLKKNPWSGIAVCTSWDLDSAFRNIDNFIICGYYLPVDLSALSLWI